MRKVTELVGLDATVEKLVDAYLKNKILTRSEIKDVIGLAVDSYKDDVYANMKETEQIKYRLIELESKIDNLTSFCKAKQKA